MVAPSEPAATCGNDLDDPTISPSQTLPRSGGQGAANRPALLFPGHALEVPEDRNLVPSLFQALDQARDRRGERIRSTRRPLRVDPRLEPIPARSGRAVGARPAPTLIHPRRPIRRRGGLDRGSGAGELLGLGGDALADPALAALLGRIGAPESARGAIGDTLGGDPTEDEGELYDAEDGDSDEDDPSGEAVTDGSDDPSEVNCESLEFQYRTVRFQVDSCWYSAYMDDWERLYRGSATVLHRDRRLGKVSSMNTFLDFAWREFRGASVGDVDTLDSLLLCWNLPSASEGTECFWMTDKGPAREAYRTALQLLLAYADDVQPEVSPCDGYATFIRSQLKGRGGVNNVGKDCQVRFRLGNADSRFETGYEVSNCGRTDSCTVGYEGNDKDGWCKGAPWDKYKDDYAWVADKSCFSAYGIGDSGCLPPDHGCGSGATLNSDLNHFIVNTAPAHMGWYGFLCDRILFLARMAFDYALDRREDGLLVALKRITAARQLAGYALRVLVRLANYWIHELGHILIGRHGHCPHRCCMDIAAFGWECAMMARLGLPLNEYIPAGGDAEDYDGESQFVKRIGEDCSSGPGFKNRLCVLATAGLPSGGMAYTHSDCYYALGGTPRDYYTIVVRA